MEHNPLLQAWTTAHELPPFGTVKAAHFAPAFDAALAAHRAEVEAIAVNPEPATFDNTCARFDASGRLLRRVDMLFGNLTLSETSPELQAVERDMAPKLAAHESWVSMHLGMFARIDGLHRSLPSKGDQLGLNPEQVRLIERLHLDFVRAGARLDAAAQTRYAAIMGELAELTTVFMQNVLGDESAYQLPLNAQADLAGLPDFVIDAAKSAAAERGLTGHVITLSRSLIVPFLTFSDRRDLRETAFKAWVQLGEHDGARDNRPIARRILALRQEQAALHGYANYADYSLVDTMAGTQSAVLALLGKVWEPAKARAAEEAEALRGIALSRGENIQIEAWDWRYYAEKVRAARYDLNEADVKPYFPLPRMLEAIFDCANRLFGLSFTETKITAYHPDVKVFEVRRGEALVGIFLSDNYARATKRGGAWMSVFRSQSKLGGSAVTPVIINNNNFAKGSANAPTLLSFDDARTLFHEFGHGLHGLLSNVTYERLAGTQVLRDFVELPSQIYEHWLSEPEVLKKHARHFETNEPIPDALVAKLKAAARFNQGFETVEFTSCALVDIALHSQTDPSGTDITAFEQTELARLGMPREITMRHRLPHFGHLFSGASYAAGYYVYMWAEVLDADGFNAFKEAGSAFDAGVAAKLLKHIYSAGNTVEPGAAYRAFRGRDPVVEPMLEGRGLVTI